MSDDEVFEPEALEPEDVPASEDEELSSEADPEELELQEEGEGEGEENEEDEDDADGGSDPELDDFEFEGQTYKVPSALKSSLSRLESMDADYTQKSQANAELKRDLEAREQAFNQQVQAQRNLFGEYTQLQNIQNELINLQKTDWQKLKAEDPFAPQEVMLRIQQLENAGRQVAASIQHKEQQRTQNEQRESAKHAEEFQAALHREIDGWSPDLNAQLTTYANSHGFSADELGGVRDVRIVKALKEGLEGRQLKERLQKQQKAAKKPKPKPEAKPLAKPSAKGRGSAKKGLSDDMSAEEWAAMRNKQVAARSRY
ncbi:hypothetical protein [Roseibium sp.]|uniref:hypothetical protein n=1 Tax=Roseibium sp. TaxID=1936156 RepID=UPI003B51DCEA